jgi:hypothetical protein
MTFMTPIPTRLSILHRSRRRCVSTTSPPLEPAFVTDDPQPSAVLRSPSGAFSLPKTKPSRS